MHDDGPDTLTGIAFQNFSSLQFIRVSERFETAKKKFQNFSSLQFIIAYEFY